MTLTRPFRLFSCAFSVVVTACGCGGAGVAVTVGGDGIVEGVDVDDGRIVFDRVVVSLGEVAVNDGSGDVVIGTGSAVIVDASAATVAAPVVVTTAKGLAVGAARVGAAIVPASDGAANANADDDTVALMADNGFSLFVSGQAERGDAVHRFAWGFSTNTRYTNCDASIDVVDGQTVEWQFTLHPEELFRTRAQDPASSTSFAALAAADGNADGVVDVDEAAAVDLDDIDNDGSYDDADSDVVTLFDFVRAQSRKVVFANGDARCDAEKR